MSLGWERRSAAAQPYFWLTAWRNLAICLYSRQATTTGQGRAREEGTVMLRRGAGSGILMGAMLCAIGGGLSLLGSRQHGPGGAQAVYVGIVVMGALRALVALIPERRRSRRRPTSQHAPAMRPTGAPYVTGAPAPAQAPAPPASYTPARSAPGRCWDCGSRVRLDSAICFHCGAAQVNAYQRASGRPASLTTGGPAPAPMESPGPMEYPRYEPARPY